MLLYINYQQSSFEGDTLASIEEIDLKCLLRNFLKERRSHGYSRNNLQNGMINILFNKNGIGNYDIAIKVTRLALQVNH
jgi:hypothetical protein